MCQQQNKQMDFVWKPVLEVHNNEDGIRSPTDGKNHKDDEQCQSQSHGVPLGFSSFVFYIAVAVDRTLQLQDSPSAGADMEEDPDV